MNLYTAHLTHCVSNPSPEVDLDNASRFPTGFNTTHLTRLTCTLQCQSFIFNQFTSRKVEVSHPIMRKVFDR